MMLKSLILFVVSLFLPGLALAKEAVASTTSVTSKVASQASKSDRFSAEWRLRLAGTEINDNTTQSKVVDIRTDLKAKYYLRSDLQLDFQPSLKMQSGNYQTIDGANMNENRVILNQAAAHYLLTKYVRLSGGALNQRHSHSQILVDSISFPAARLESLMQIGNLRGGFSLETAIPTSTSLSANTNKLEETPSLNTATLKMTFQPIQSFAWKASVGYFMYDNLPSSVAEQSRLLGNDIIKVSDAQYLFIYDFKGFEAASELVFSAGKTFSLKLGAEFLQNQNAPTGLNQAYRAFGESTYVASSTLDLTLGGSYFHIQPEAAVSYFNASGFETNRVGYSIHSLLSFKKEGFSIGLNYTDSEVIYVREPQSREKTLMLKLETFYANI